MLRVIFCLALISTAVSFQVKKNSFSSTSLNVRSKSVPFLNQQPALDGTLPGDVGFDPLGLSSLWLDVRIFYGYFYIL